MTQEMNEPIITIGYYGAKCPYCDKDIFVPQYRAVPITLEDFQEQTARQVKAMREARKAERKDKP